MFASDGDCDTDAYLNSKDVVFCSTQLRILADIAMQVEMANLCEIPRKC